VSEAGGPATQAGILYQNQITALYLGRMIDRRERPPYDQPVHIRVEAPECVDDFVIRFADGGRRFFQVKSSLRATGAVWDTLWLSFNQQLESDFKFNDRLELVLGASIELGSDLSEIVKRHESSSCIEWMHRLTTAQRKLVNSIKAILSDDIESVFRIVKKLDVSLWSSDSLVRDLVPNWMPVSTVSNVVLFNTLTSMACEGAKVRLSFDSSTLCDRLHDEADISVCDPPNWGSAKYRETIAALSVIEVPGTDFSRQPADHYLWPKCVRYEKDRVPDFDDDFHSWRRPSQESHVDFRDFPGPDLGAVVVIAGPGFGKTTLVHAIARKVANAQLLPAVIQISKLSDSDLSIIEYLSGHLNAEFDVKVDWRAAANSGLLILLLDGLDEISHDRRAVILERLKLFRAGHPNVSWMMTVRDATALPPQPNILVVELMPLEVDDISSYVDFYRPGEPKLTKLILERIDKRSDLAHLVKIPIFLALLLVMRKELESLSRSELLDSYLEILFRPSSFKATQKLDPVDTTVLRKITERAAFEALEMGAVGLRLNSLEICVKELAPSLRTDDVRDALTRRGVLKKTGLVSFVFPFPIVQEYLASSVLLEYPLDKIVKRLSMTAKRPWAQAIQFVLERHPGPAHLIDTILKVDDDVFFTELRLLGRCLANGMAASTAQWQAIGERLAGIWGDVSWSADRLVSGVIIDAFTRPLHSAVRAKLGKRRFIHSGAGAIVAKLRDDALSLNVLGELLVGNIEHMTNLGDFQLEVNRLGTRAFLLFIERSKVANLEKEEGQAISALISHLQVGSVDPEKAFLSASDTSLPIEIRLVSWVHSMRPLDNTVKALVSKALTFDGYHMLAAVALLLSSTQIDSLSILRLLKLSNISDEKIIDVISCLVRNWGDGCALNRLNELLASNELSPCVRDALLLYALKYGDGAALNELIFRMQFMSIKTVSGTLMMLGHVLESDPVERAVGVIANRDWEAEDRILISSSLASGLMYKLDMYDIGSGSLDLSPLHPGRTVPFSLFEKWMSYKDYDPKQRLRLVLNAVKLGVPGALENLRSVFDQVFALSLDERESEQFYIADAIETLCNSSQPFALEELEEIASSASYNIAARVVLVIAKRGGIDEVHALIRIYEAAPSSRFLQQVIIGVLEPIAGRLGLRVSFHNGRLLMRMV